MTRVPPRRSGLNVPGATTRPVGKSGELHCDLTIPDPADAVAPEAKHVARRQAVEAVSAGGFGRREVVIRVNGLDTPWGRDDLAAAAAAKPDAILAPKVSSPADVAAYASGLSGETRL